MKIKQFKEVFTMKKFYEKDVTNFSKERLLSIHMVISNHGWDKYIENLEMILDDNDRILIRGWATKKNWENFYNKVVNSNF